MKKIKKILAIILSFALVLTLVPGGAFSVSAATNHTLAEAVNWIVARGNESWWEDVDGAYGCQCVDLVMKYYQYLGLARSNASAQGYITVKLPDGWWRDHTPSPGAIFVCPGGEWNGVWQTVSNGHVGLVHAVSGSIVKTVETNTGSSEGGNDAYAKFNERKFTSNVWYIHPNFSDHSHSYSGSVTKQPTCTEDGVRTYTCTCGASYTETISKLGHDYVPVVTDPTCTAGGYTTNTCSRCHDTYISDETDSIDHSCVLSKISINGNNTADIDYYCTECKGQFKKTINISNGKSEYISEKIIGLYDETTQEKTQYRSAEKETKTSTTKELEGWKYDGKYSEYGEWSEWKTGTASKNELTDVETCTMYMWYAYICPNCGRHDPYTGACSNCGTTLNANHFWSKWYNFPFSNGEASVEGKTKTTGLGNGKLYSANDHAPEAGYRTRNREYLLYKVSSFSDWQDEEIIADENTIVETRTVYSYDLSGSGAHSYKKEWSSDENQHWHECSECSAKIDVGDHVYDNDNDTTCNVCGYVRSIENPEAPVDENAPQIVFESKRARKATEFTVTAEIKNNPGFSAASIKIIYDTSRLQLETALLSEAYSSGATISYDNLPKITFVKGGNVTTDGAFLTLTFKVLDTAEPGDSLISLEYDEGDISNYLEEDVNFAVVQGTIAVVDYIPGDINDDDKVNTKDLTRLLKYLNDEPVEVNEYALDVNGDGKVNTKDLTRLLKYLNDEPVEIF